MHLLWMAIVALLWQIPADTAANKVFVRDNEIWVQTASAQRQLTHDGVAKRLPTLSPSGNRLFYVLDHPVPNNAPKEEIVLLDLNGRISRRIIPKGYVPQQFWRLDWIDDQRIGAMSCGHVNCMYWVISPDSGKTIEVMSGGFDFIWSHNRQFVARLQVGDSCEDGYEADSCSEHDSVLMNRDGVTLYPHQASGQRVQDKHTHDIGLEADPRFVWSPDDNWVAFTDIIGPEGDWYAVILSPSGEMLRDTLPIDPDYDTALVWLDDTHLEVRTSHQVFQFALRGKNFSEVRGNSSR
jgi:hypothetical protein